MNKSFIGVNKIVLLLACIIQSRYICSGKILAALVGLGNSSNQSDKPRKLQFSMAGHNPSG